MGWRWCLFFGQFFWLWRLFYRITVVVCKYFLSGENKFLWSVESVFYSCICGFGCILSFGFSLYLFSCCRLGKFRDLAYMIIGAFDVIYLLVILIFWPFYVYGLILFLKLRLCLSIIHTTMIWNPKKINVTPYAWVNACVSVRLYTGFFISTSNFQLWLKIEAQVGK